MQTSWYLLITCKHDTKCLNINFRNEQGKTLVDVEIVTDWTGDPSDKIDLESKLFNVLKDIAEEGALGDTSVDLTGSVNIGDPVEGICYNFFSI